MDIRQKIFEIRSFTPIPFILILLFFAVPTVQSLIAGFALACLGEALRFWGVSICGSETRTTGTVGATHLVTEGPFGHVRNPLYVGNILMYVGISLMANFMMPWFPLIVFIFFVTQYHLIVSREEEHLRTAFAEEYAVYVREVPRFIPRLRRYIGDHSFHREPDFKRGLQSEMRTLQAFIGISLIIVVRYFYL